MSKGKHTPLPWKYYTALGAECVYAGAPPRDNPQGIIAHMDKQGDATNAAFIVKAVNSHDQLVEALKDAIQSYRAQCESWDEWCGLETCHKCGRQARRIAEWEAILKATGEEM